MKGFEKMRKTKDIEGNGRKRHLFWGYLHLLAFEINL